MQAFGKTMGGRQSREFFGGTAANITPLPSHSAPLRFKPPIGMTADGSSDQLRLALKPRLYNVRSQRI